METNVGFAIGTGRCGTEFLARVVELEGNAVSCHERNPFNEAFQRYCAWYRLGVDSEGFLSEKGREISSDLRRAPFSFESSAYLSLAVRGLYDRFRARFVLLVRSPERVVNSYIQKGWYAEPIVRADPQSAPGYQPHQHRHHIFSRVVPIGSEYDRWKGLGQVGKLAWYWNSLNRAVIEQFDEIPVNHRLVQKIEDLDYDAYERIGRFFGIESTVTREAFVEIAARRPNSFRQVPTVADWTRRDIDEFEAEVAPMAELLGYEFRVHRLPVPEPRSSGEPIVQRVRRSLRRRVRAILSRPIQ